jgi:hypothetical protein
MTNVTHIKILKLQITGNQCIKIIIRTCPYDTDLNKIQANFCT